MDVSGKWVLRVTDVLHRVDRNFVGQPGVASGAWVLRDTGGFCYTQRTRLYSVPVLPSLPDNTEITMGTRVSSPRRPFSVIILTSAITVNNNVRLQKVVGSAIQRN